MKKQKNKQKTDLMNRIKRSLAWTCIIKHIEHKILVAQNSKRKWEDKLEERRKP